MQTIPQKKRELSRLFSAALFVLLHYCPLSLETQRANPLTAEEFSQWEDTPAAIAGECSGSPISM